MRRIEVDPATLRVSRAAARFAACALLAALLAGCGFQLRGTADLPFKTIAVPGETQLGEALQRSIDAGTNTKVVPQSENPQAILALLSEARDRLILSLNAQGQVTEYELRYLVSFRVYSPKGLDYIPTSQIVLRRPITFNDQVLAKEQEADLIYREMQQDMVQLIMRRLAAARPEGS
jgi:LPS-assembly lipoprotein